MAEASRQNIHVYLFDPAVDSFEKALSLGCDPDNFVEVQQSEGYQTRLYTKVKPSKRTKWMKLLATGIVDHKADPFARFSNNIASAALLIQKGSEVMAVTFGQGRHLIDLNGIVKRFGLIVALNLAPSRKLGSAQMKRHSDMTQTRAVMNSRLTDLRRFGYDSEEDLLVQVSAKLERHKQLGYAFDGKDSIALVADLSFEDLPYRSFRLARCYRKTSYKRKFPEIGNLEPVSDTIKIHRLNEAMCSAIVQEDHGGFHLAPYDVITATDEGFGFRATYDLGGSDPHVELDLGQFVAEASFGGSDDFRKLKDNTISFVSEVSAELHGPWPVLNCLVGEVTLDGLSYFVSGGQWMCPEADYLKRLNKAVAHLLPDPDLATLTVFRTNYESELIDEAVKHYGSGYEQIHPRSISIGGGHSTIEFADVVSDKKLIYAKVAGSARDMSHLLTQAANGVKALASAEFRQAARSQYASKAPKAAALIPEARPSLSSYAVVLLLGVSRVRQPEQFPIVQRIALKRLLDEVEVSGVQVLLHQVVTKGT
jgi:uncharacterized protein (TIGR04141 family)